MKLKKSDFILYAVTDRTWLENQTLYEQVEQALKGGVTFVQLREKNLSDEDFYKEALEIKALCKKYKVPFVINDDVELALRVDADGVHVGQEDMACKRAREILGENKIIGVSTHNVEEALRAVQDGADYLGAGAVFSTSTKSNVTNLSKQTLTDICKAVDVPVVAIGGISQKNVEQLSGSGISGVAVISAIFASKDIKNAAESLKNTVSRMVEL